MTDPTIPADPNHPKEIPPEVAVPDDTVRDTAERDAEGTGSLEPEAAAPPARRDPLPVLFGIGVLVLIGAVVFLWRHPLNLASFSSQPAPQVQATATPPPTPPALPAPAPAAPPASQPAPPATTTTSPPTTTAAATPAVPPSGEPPPPPPVADPPAVAAAPPPPAAPPSPTASQAPAQTPAKPDAAPAGADQLADLQHQVADLQQQVAKLSQQTDQLAQAKPPAPPDLGPLDQRISALENRPLPPDPAPVEKRLAALENRPVPADPAPAIAGLAATLGARIDGLTTRADQMTAHQGSSETATAGRLDADDAKIAGLDAKIAAVAKQVADLAGASDRASRLARVQVATAALTAGRPLGDIPDAPPALARFRTDAPPTEASLRLAFPAAAQAASQAAEPDTGALPFWQAVQNRAESLVTVRRGDHVVVGDPTAGVIARARVALDAGDLAGAVSALGALTGPPAAAMAGWTGQAKALLDARAALATLAARA